MSYPINYPTPQGANVQMFFEHTGDTTTQDSQTWIKPQGVSFVFFCLIGAGATGATATSDGTATAAAGGGGSGSVLNFLVPAFFIPDQLNVRVGTRRRRPGEDTVVLYRQKDGTGYSLLRARGGDTGDAATIVTPGVSVDGAGGAGGIPADSSFRALGISNATTGQAGSAGNTAQTLPTDIFVIGGNGGSGAIVTGHYGYSTGTGGQGYGVISPIINSRTNRSLTGATGNSTAFSQYAGFGSGGNGASTSASESRVGLPGGPGLAVIISW